jgi:hypothetical protein
VKVVLEMQGGFGRVTVGCENCCVINKGCCGGGLEGRKVRGVEEIEERS